MLVVKGLARVAAQVALFAALLLVPAGTWAWPRAIQFLVGFAVVHTIATLALAWLAPESLEARLPTASEEKPPKADRIVALFLGLMLLGWFVFIPIDVGFALCRRKVCFSFKREQGEKSYSVKCNASCISA